MSETERPRIIAVEEHYQDPELAARAGGPTGGDDGLQTRLRDFTELRIAGMDAAGIDMQVIGHGSPSGQRLPANEAVEIARAVNDRFARAIAPFPMRFAGYAMLPTAVPEKAADELQRCVEELGFVGALLNGLQDGTTFLDEKRFWPIYARAEKLDVPIYMHPGFPHKAVTEAYYQDYVKDYARVITAGWGFGVEAATQAVRMVLSGVFNAHPNLKIILGHLGETLPFLMWRINHAFARPGQKELSFREVFCRHFHVTTSGFFSNPALYCVMTEIGADRIMFAVDYPFVANEEGASWARGLQISVDDKTKILSGNAARLFRLD